MSAAAPAYSAAWKVGRYICTLTVPAIEPGRTICAVVEWAPEVPQRLCSSARREYRRGRERALTALASELGLNIALLEI